MSQQLSLNIHLNSQATLEDFCWRANTLIQQTLTNFIGGEGERYIYLWGNKGSGKSHLLQACCHAFALSGTSIYLPLPQIKEWGPEALDGIENQDLICLDDIQSIAHDRPWEEAVFHLYNRIRDRDTGLLLISGENPPSGLALTLPDLRSRLSAGLVLHIQDMSDEDKLASLKNHAQQRGFEMSEGVGQYLIARCSRNMHDLIACLDQLDEASLSAQRKITIPFVREVLGF